MKKAIIIALSIIVIIIAGFFVFMNGFVRSGIKSIETKKYSENFYIANGKITNSYVVIDGGNIAIFDAFDDEKSGIASLKSLGIEPEKVNYVFLTHSDRDHIAALGKFTNAKIYLPALEEQMFSGKYKRFGIFTNKLSVSYSKINDYEEIKIGNTTIKSISAIGHTMGSCAYLVNNKLLISGDTFSIKKGKLAVMNPFFNMNTKVLDNSIRERFLKFEGIDAVFTAHYGMISDWKKAIEGF